MIPMYNNHHYSFLLSIVFFYFFLFNTYFFTLQLSIVVLIKSFDTFSAINCKCKQHRHIAGGHRCEWARSTPWKCARQNPFHLQQHLTKQHANQGTEQPQQLFASNHLWNSSWNHALLNKLCVFSRPMSWRSLSVQNISHGYRSIL